MFEKEDEEWIMDCVCKDCSLYEKCKSKEHCTCKECSKDKWQNGAEFGYNKAFVEADKNLKAIFTDFNKAKELIQDLIDSLEVIDGEQIRELKVVKEAEQFLLNIERYENGK